MNATREPLVIRGAVVAVIVAIVHLLVLLGVIEAGAVEAALVTVVDVVGTAVLVIWTRGKVTPVAAPRLPAAPVGGATDNG